MKTKKALTGIACQRFFCCSGALMLLGFSLRSFSRIFEVL